jgi:hypothetical protein
MKLYRKFCAYLECSLVNVYWNKMFTTDMVEKNETHILHWICNILARWVNSLHVYQTELQYNTFKRSVTITLHHYKQWWHSKGYQLHFCLLISVSVFCLWLLPLTSVSDITLQLTKYATLFPTANLIMSLRCRALNGSLLWISVFNS